MSCCGSSRIGWRVASGRRIDRVPNYSKHSAAGGVLIAVSFLNTRRIPPHHRSSQATERHQILVISQDSAVALTCTCAFAFEIVSKPSRRPSTVHHRTVQEQPARLRTRTVRSRSRAQPNRAVSLGTVRYCILQHTSLCSVVIDDRDARHPPTVQYSYSDATYSPSQRCVGTDPTTRRAQI